MKKATILLLIFISWVSVNAQDLPNVGFENWSVNFLFEGLEDWNTSNSNGSPDMSGVTKSTDAYSGNYSVKLQSLLIDEDSIFNFIYHGTIGEGPSGGIPYTDEFDQVRGFYKCNMAGQDSATVYIVKYYGASPTQIISKIGGVQETWSEFMIDVPGGTCDSLFIGFISSDVMNESNINFDSWIMFDSIYLYNSLGGTPSALPNHDMEDWIDYSYQDIDDWYCLNAFLYSMGMQAVVQTEDAYSGDYALLLQGNNIYGDIIPGFLSIGEITMDDENPILPVPYTYQPTSLVGYYKYTPESDDAAIVNIQMLVSGESIGGNYSQLDAASEWTYFEIPLSYSGVPEELQLIFGSGENAGSVLYLDDVNFDFETDISEKPGDNFSVYPNPGNGIFNISGAYINTLSIYDLTGKKLLNKIVNSRYYLLNLTGYPAGIYLLKVKTTSGVQTKKLIVK